MPRSSNPFVTVPVLRWGILLTAFALLLYAGFQREKKLLILEQGKFCFIPRYPKPVVAQFEKFEMQGTLGIRLPVKLQSVVFYSLLFTLLNTVIVGLYSRSRLLARFTAVLYLAYMLVCFVLLKLGDLGVDYRLSTGLSHYIEDLFLSPFLILAFIAIIRAFGMSEDAVKHSS
jgi:hypothetical protein